MSYDVPRPKRSNYTHRTFSGKWFDQASYNAAVARWEEGRQQHNEIRRLSRRSRGSMMYGRSYNSSEEPTGASGEIDPSTGKGHATQYYADRTRVSWDTDGEGESNTHWTNQNVSKKNRNRHTPPPHAK